MKLRAIIVIMVTLLLTTALTVSAGVEQNCTAIAEQNSTIGEVIYSVPSPVNYSTGLAWDGTALWVSGAFNSTICRFDPFTNSVLTSFHGPTSSARDLAWDGANLWVTSWWGCYIYQINPIHGSGNAFPAPFSGHPDGLAWDGDYLWIGEENGGIYKVDPSTGEAIYSFYVIRGSTSNPRGLAWDGEHIWAGYQFMGVIKEHDVAISGSSDNELTIFASPSGPFQQGLAWDGEYLWSTGNDNYIYQIKVTNTLTIFSSPSGVTFTVDSEPHITPWSKTYSEGSSVNLEMPATHAGYVWDRWSDTDTNRIKTVIMDTDITLTAVYVPRPEPVGGKANPINKAIINPVNKLSLLTPYIGLTMLLAVAVATVVYVKKRKLKHQ